MRIGVASTDRQEEEEWVMEELVSRGEEALFVDPSDVSYVLQGGDLSATVDGATLHDLDLLYMRRTRFDVEASRDLIAAMNALGIRTVERKDVFFNPLSKFYSLLSFVGADIDGVSIPATGIVRSRSEAGVIADTIGYPLIMKPVAGREGESVDRLEDRSDLEDALPDTDFPVLLQEYIDITAEYRVLVVGDTALGAVRKEGEGVTQNYAQGATFEPVDVPELEVPAATIAQRLGIEVAGVDIIETSDGDYYEIECNRCPQFKGFSEAHPDIDVPARIVDYLLEAV